jgi:GT2 family glycosyltransferase
VDGLLDAPDVRVIVADNASTDGSPETLDGLPVTLLRLRRNGGFAYGCNRGWRAGTAPNVLFLNPDAAIDERSLSRLASAVARPHVGAAAPRIVDGDGSLEFSLRRFPRLRSTFAQALFLHRVLPRSRWTDELIRDEESYAEKGSPEWVSGACILIRRDVLEAVGGWDEGFFLYGEDMDICRRLRDAGWDIRFEPEAVCRHHGGVSAPRASLLPVLAESRLRYSYLHDRPVAARLMRVGIALGEGLHALLSTGGRATRKGHAEALRRALAWRRPSAAAGVPDDGRGRLQTTGAPCPPDT